MTMSRCTSVSRTPAVSCPLASADSTTASSSSSLVGSSSTSSSARTLNLTRRLTSTSIFLTLLLLTILTFTSITTNVVGQANQTAIVLVDSIPAPMATIAYQGWAYYTYFVPQSGMDLIVSVSPFGSDPDLYISQQYQYPNRTNAQWKSSWSGSDIITIKGCNPGMYYIGVYGFRSGRFQIVASAYLHSALPTPILLTDGIPTSSALAAKEMRFFKIDLSTSLHHADLTIILTASLGDPDMFVTNDGTMPNRTHYNVSATRFGSDTIKVYNPIATVWTIGVLADSATFFSIVAVTNETILELIVGQSVTESLAAGQTEYFVIDVPDNTLDLTITVTSLTGDPDLFVSNVTNKPRYGNYTYRAAGWGNDSITIPATNLNVGPYWIAVYSYRACTFTVLANFGNQTRLVDGRPQHDGMTSAWGATSKYYTFFVQPTNLDVSFSLIPTMGFAALYVSKNREPEPSRDWGTVDWYSYVWYSSQMIIIPGNDTKACQWTDFPPGTDQNSAVYCTYYVLVKAQTDVVYTLTAINGLTAVGLVDGTPTQATVPQDRYTRFYYTAGCADCDLFFSLTVMQGDPDIYVVTRQRDVNETGATKYFNDWKSELSGGDTLQILYDDPKFQLGDYEISIYGFSYSVFLLTATSSQRNGNISSITLVDGLPVNGRIYNQSAYTYYTFRPSVPLSGVSFAVNKRAGDPDVFVSMYPQIPNIHTSTWRSMHVGSDFIQISGADPLACGNLSPGQDCIYYIAVRAYTANTLYSIIASSSLVTGQLQSGVPVYGQVDANSYVNYYIDVTSQGQPALTISVTPLSQCDPDMFVSLNNTRPNRTDYTWRGINFGSDQLTILNPNRAKHYISIYGANNRNCSYSLTASYQAVELSPGLPYSDGIEVFLGMKVYKFYVAGSDSGLPPPGGLTVTLNAQVNADNDMFIQNNGSTASPTQTNGWNSTRDSVTGGRRIHISADDLQACWGGSNCTYTLLVRSWLPVGRFGYTITYYYGDDHIILQPGVPFPATVYAQTSINFKTFIASPQYNVSITTTQGIGSIKIYASQIYSEPNAANSSWSGVSGVGQSTHLSALASQLSFGWLWISVVGDTDSAFSLVVTSESMFLQSGQPQSSQCGPHLQAQYYFMNFINPEKDLTKQGEITFDISNAVINGNKIFGDFTLYISTNLVDPNNQQPNATNNVWSATKMEGATFSIDPKDPNYCQYNCTFYIAVACPLDAAIQGTYALTVASSDQPDQLSVNAASQGTVALGEQKFYSVWLQNANNFSFILDPCVGATDLFVSSTYKRPDGTPGHFDQSFESPNTRYNYAAVVGTRGTNKMFFGVAPSKSATKPVQFIVKTQYFGTYLSTSPVLSSAILTLTALEPGTIRFEFTTATPSVVTSSKPEDLVYNIFWAPGDDVNAILSTECGAQAVFAATGNIRTVTGLGAGQTYSFALDGLADMKYKINVLVTDPSKACTTGATAYTATTAQPNGAAGGGGGVSKVALGIGITLAILAIILVFYLVIKNRRLSKELEIEMHDVPSAALRKAARGAPDVSKVERAQRHHSLLSDDAIASDADSYAPPSAMANPRISEL